HRQVGGRGWRGPVLHRAGKLPGLRLRLSRAHPPDPAEPVPEMPERSDPRATVRHRPLALICIRLACSDVHGGSGMRKAGPQNVRRKSNTSHPLVGVIMGSTADWEAMANPTG